MFFDRVLRYRAKNTHGKLTGYQSTDKSRHYIIKFLKEMKEKNYDKENSRNQ